MYNWMDLHHLEEETLGFLSPLVWSNVVLCSELLCLLFFRQEKV